MARKSEVQKERKKERERKKPNLDVGSILKDLSIPCSSPSKQILFPPPLQSKARPTKPKEHRERERREFPPTPPLTFTPNSPLQMQQETNRKSFRCCRLIRLFEASQRPGTTLIVASPDPPGAKCHIKHPPSSSSAEWQALT